MHDLTGFQRDLLSVLGGLHTPHGLAIKAELDGYYGAPINHGRLYPNLDVLVAKGLVEKAELDGRTNTYTLTRRGREAVETRWTWEDEHAGHLLERVASAE